MKTCTKCQIEQPVDNFYNDKKSKDGKKIYCKDCMKSYNKKYKKEHRTELNTYQREFYLDNRERITNHVTNWQRSNPHKVREINQRRRTRVANADGNFAAEDIHQLLELQKECPICQLEFDGHNHSIDHIQPLSREGSNDPYNLMLLCNSCNKKKNSKNFEEFHATLDEEAAKRYVETLLLINLR